VVKIHEGICGPQLGAQLFPPHQLSGALYQRDQDLKWLLLQSYLGAIPAQLASREVQLEEAEMDNSIRTLASRRHVAISGGR
jgi:hypothetical protein